MINRRLRRLEQATGEAEKPYYFESSVLIDLCAEMGVPPYMHTIKPKDVESYRREVTKPYIKREPVE